MRSITSAFLLITFFFLGSCSEQDKKLTITTYLPGSDSYNAAVAIKEVLSDDGWEFTIISNTHEKGIETLRNGKVDLAITSNDISIESKSLRTLIPLYSEVLVSLINEESPLLAANNLVEILSIAQSNRLKIVFSEKGSYSQLFANRMFNDLELTEDMYEAFYFPQGDEYNSGKLELVKSQMPDLITIMGNVDNEIIRELMDLGYVFRNKENLVENMDESYFSSLALKMVRSFPVAIPAYTVSEKQTTAVVAPGLFTSLISNKNLDDELVYDLVQDIIRAQPELIRYNSNFFDMSEDFDPRYLNFQIHPAAMDYYERDEPSIFERYAELTGVVFSMFVVFMTLMVTLNRVMKQRKKDRIDVYYLEVLKIRKNDNSQEAMEQLLALETKALEQLVEEKLAADSSFIVFMHQLSQARLELSEKIKQV
jgi:TRAP-type uncharacterized transport system substrate-binding protein